MATTPLPALQKWLQAASPVEIERLARIAGANTNYIRYMLINGERKCSSEFAAKLEEAAELLRAANPELPDLRRVDLSETCASCPMSKGCGGGKCTTKTFWHWQQERPE